MTNRKPVTYPDIQQKQRKLSVRKIGGLLALVFALCCIFSVGISLISGGNSTPTPVAEISLPTKAHADVPTEPPIATVETQSTSTFVQPAEIISPELADSAAPVSVSTSLPNVEGGGSLRVHFIDVGQGDATLIQAPDGKVALIDGGDTDTGVIQYLQSMGIRSLDFIVATHPNADHIGGLVQVLQTIPVDKVVTNGQMHSTSIYERFLDAIASSKADYVELKQGDTLSLGDLVFDVVSPISLVEDDLNNNSLVLRLVYGKVTFLFTGDAGAEAESKMLASGLDLSATILKVGHHGSSSSSTPAFLSAVKPKVAIYFAGKGNDYGHPHAETLAILTTIGPKIYGTDVNGTINVNTDGTNYTIETERLGQVQASTDVIPSNEETADPEINVVSLTSPIAPGGQARLTIKTVPGAATAITVYYKSGPSQAQGLGPQVADSNGNVTWSWKVGSRTTPGTWKIVVTANVNGQNISIEIPFEVR